MSWGGFKERAEYRFWTKEQEAELVRHYCLEGMRASEIVQLPLFANSKFSNSKLHSKVKNLKLVELRKNRKAAKAKVAELLAQHRVDMGMSKSERLMKMQNEQEKSVTEDTQNDDIYSTDDENEESALPSPSGSASAQLMDELHSHEDKPNEKSFKPQQQKMDPKMALKLIEWRVASAQLLDPNQGCPICFVFGHDMDHAAVDCPNLGSIGPVGPPS